ncbi:10515_t:CDS:2, partial [Funneliformis caledonium]
MSTAYDANYAKQEYEEAKGKLETFENDDDGSRTFTAANGAYLDINFYVELINAIQKLSTYLIQDKFCLVYGHRQSGKTTAIYATARWLAHHSTQIEVGGFSRSLQIYVISFNGGVQLEHGQESLLVVLIFDEGSALLNHDRKIIEDFMEATVELDRFIEVDIKMLLDDYARESSVKLESADIAKDIFKRTLRHKGLTGTCCSILETMCAVKNMATVLLDDRKCATVTLTDVMAQRDTYAFIIQSLKNLSSESHKLVKDKNVSFLLAEGIIFITSRDGNAVVIECAAPVLRDFMISHINGSTFKVKRPPNTDNLDVRWLMDHAIKNMAIQHVFADQAANSNGQPSEYTFQIEFVIICHLLAHLDILLRDGSSLPQYGFELVVEATHSAFDEYCRRVTPVHVIYDVQKGLVELVFRDSKKSVSIEGSAWQ